MSDYTPSSSNLAALPTSTEATETPTGSSGSDYVVLTPLRSDDENGPADTASRPGNEEASIAQAAPSDDLVGLSFGTELDTSFELFGGWNEASVSPDLLLGDGSIHWVSIYSRCCPSPWLQIFLTLCCLELA